MSTPTPNTPPAAPAQVPVYSPKQSFSISAGDIPPVLLVAIVFGLWPYLLPMIARGYPPAEILFVGIGAVAGAVAAFCWHRSQEHEPTAARVALAVVAVVASLVIGSMYAPLIISAAYATIVAAAILATLAWITTKI